MYFDPSRRECLGYRESGARGRSIRKLRQNVFVVGPRLGDDRSVCLPQPVRPLIFAHRVPPLHAGGLIGTGGFAVHVPSGAATIVSTTFAGGSKPIALFCT